LRACAASPVEARSATVRRARDPRGREHRIDGETAKAGKR